VGLTLKSEQHTHTWLFEDVVKAVQVVHHTLVA